MACTNRFLSIKKSFFLTLITNQILVFYTWKHTRSDNTCLAQHVRHAFSRQRPKTTSVQIQYLGNSKPATYKPSHTIRLNVTSQYLFKCHSTRQCTCILRAFLVQVLHPWWNDSLVNFTHPNHWHKILFRLFEFLLCHLIWRLR